MTLLISLTPASGIAPSHMALEHKEIIWDFAASPGLFPLDGYWWIWWRADSGLSLGNSSSGSTIASNLCRPIFDWAWDFAGNAFFGILNSDGSPSEKLTKNADWAANKRLSFPQLSGYSLAFQRGANKGELAGNETLGLTMNNIPQHGGNTFALAHTHTAAADAQGLHSHSHIYSWHNGQQIGVVGGTDMINYYLGMYSYGTGSSGTHSHNISVASASPSFALPTWGKNSPDPLQITPKRFFGLKGLLVCTGFAV